MKVLLVNGSPHAQGSTFTALSEIEGVLTKNGIESEFFQLGTKPVHGCIDCKVCRKIKKCVFDDDICNALIEKAAQCDGFIFGSPVYYGSANGAFCAILDRAFYAATHVFTGKPAAAIVVCRRGGAGSAFDRLNKYITISQMPLATSQYWNAIHGHNGEQVRQDKEGLQIMRTLGENLTWLLRNIENGKGTVPPPHIEDRVRTDFVLKYE